MKVWYPTHGKYFTGDTELRGRSTLFTQKEKPGGQITRLQDTLLLEKTNNTKELVFHVLELHDYSFTIFVLYNRALAKFIQQCQLHLNNSSYPRNGKHPPLHLTILVLKLDAIILQIAHTLHNCTRVHIQFERMPKIAHGFLVVLEIN